MKFKNVFNEVWEEYDKLCVGHSDYWSKMKLRVGRRLEEELEVSLKN